MTLKGRIAFSSGRTTDFDIWTLNLESGLLSQLTSGDNLNDYPAVTRDGQKIAYISTGSDFIPSLWIMDSNGENKKRLTEKVFCRHPSFSPDSKSIFFSANIANKQDIDIYKIDISQPAKAQQVVNLAGSDFNPSVSPCGTKLLFCSEKEGGDTEIKEINLETGLIRVLATHPSRDKEARYSPDGKKICFVSYRESYDQAEYQNLRKMIAAEVKSGNIRNVNSLILQLKELEGDSEIYIMDADGQNLRQLTANQGEDCQPCWSPCGNYVCFCSSNSSLDAVGRLKIIRADNGQEIAFEFDRSALEAEIGASRLLNTTVYQRLIPDWLEKKFAGSSFWGQERNPSWGI